MTQKIKAQKPRGLPDLTDDYFQCIESMRTRILAVFDQWGFDGLDTGGIEFAEALGQFLPDDDRPNSGVFSFQDEDDAWLSLRYDHTAPLARYAAQNWQFLQKPYRRYAFGPVWRNEKPGPGRFRQFLQCDADTVGAGGPQADAEMLALASAVFQALGYASEAFALRINSRALLDAALDMSEVGAGNQKLTVFRALDKLERLGQTGVAELLGKGRMDESGDFTKGAELSDKAIANLLAFVSIDSESGDVFGQLDTIFSGHDSGQRSLENLQSVCSLAETLGADKASLKLDPSIVRGLGYYTGPVFEIEVLRPYTDDAGQPLAFGSVGGGGRYDDLITRFTGQQVPATGFSIGLSRLAAAIVQDQNHTKRRGPVIVLNLDKEKPQTALSLVKRLRDGGVRAEGYMGSSGMRPQMKYADKRRARLVVMMGEDEAAKGVVTLKDLDEGLRQAAEIETNEAWKTERPGQFEVPQADLVAAVKSILGDEA